MHDNNSEPCPRVRTLSEFFALARAMESDAADRYAQTARQLRDQNENELAKVFEGLADIERGHVAHVDGWAATTANAAGLGSPFAIPDTFDAPASLTARSKLITPYLALASAVRHEERSFAFWTYVAAEAVDGEIKAAAERMAHEELEHAAMLRRERRKYFQLSRSGPRQPGETAVTVADLARYERTLSKLLLARAAAGEAEPYTRLAAEALEAAGRLESIRAHERQFSTVALPQAREADPAALSEYLAEAYLSMAEAAADDLEIADAHNLASRAVQRLQTLALHAT